jgi:crotonobetainyl-CoA:carnitine CoA-transferase CaiB-like acyl-CoA transferase
MVWVLGSGGRVDAGRGRQLTTSPLESVRILDLTRLLPGGYATLLLADLGADVVKVEEPGKGDYIRWTPPLVGDFSTGHIALNRNKRSITLNLRTDGGRDVFVRLVERFDVVVESFRPGVMDRLGLGYEKLRDKNPRLVYCAITGYGQDGPRAQTAGHDANYASYAGMLSIVGEEGRRPVIPGVQVGDLGGGGMAAVIAILTALVRRGRTGDGDFCDVSMTDGIVSWLSIHASEYFAGGKPPERERMHLSGAYPCYRVYPASDGWISIGALEPQFWAALCEAIDRIDLIGDAFAQGERRDVVVRELEGLFSSRSRDEWMKLFDGKDVCVAPVNDFSEAFADEQVRHREMVVNLELPGTGAFETIGNPIKLASDEAPTLRRPPPGMGEHNEEVVAEIGLGPDDVERLRSTGAM